MYSIQYVLDTYLLFRSYLQMPGMFVMYLVVLTEYVTSMYLACTAHSLQVSGSVSTKYQYIQYRAVIRVAVSTCFVPVPQKN